MRNRIHAAFTAAASIKKGRSDDLRIQLQKLNQTKSSLQSTLKFLDSTLYVSGVVLPAQCYDGESLPETFVFATTYTGWRSRHLTELVSACRADLCTLFEHCVGFPSPPVTNGMLIQYLKAHRQRGAFNSRYNCITKQDVDKESDLRNEIERYVDKAQSLNAFYAQPAREVKTLIQRHILVQGPAFEWCHKPDRKSLLEFAVVNRVPLLQVIFLTLFIMYIRRSSTKNKIAAATVAAAAFLLLYGTLLYISSKKNDTAPRQPDSRVRQLGATQLNPVVNGMTAAAPLKPGRLRRMFYSFALRVINLFAPSLMEIPTVTTIRWLSINNKKRLLFLSNYSNSTDFYVREFLSGGSPLGINFMFSNGQGFPDAYLLAYDGISKDPEGYMNAVHYGQQVTDFWYAHEPSLTSDIINKNRLIRNGLFKNMSEKKAKEWLKLI